MKKLINIIGLAIKDSLVCRKCYWSRPNPDCKCGYESGYFVAVNWKKVSNKLLSTQSQLSGSGEEEGR